MTYISSNNKSHTLTPTDQNYSAIDATALSNANSTSQPQLYLGPEYTNVPGIINLLFTPCMLWKGTKALYRAYQIRDREGIFENGLRLVQAPLDIGNSLTQVSLYVRSASPFCAEALKKSALLLTFITITGLIFCAIEGVLEGMRLIKSIRFNRSFQPNISPTMSQEDREKNYLSTLLRLKQTCFVISPEEVQKIELYVKNLLPDATSDVIACKRSKIITNTLEAKKNILIRRVHPWLAKEIENTLPQLMGDLQSPLQDNRKRAAAKAAALFDNILIQSQKKQLILTVGLMAVLFTVAGLIAASVLSGFTLPLVLSIAGSLFSLVRYWLHLGLMDSKKWDFSVSNCVPGIFRRIHHKIFNKEKPEATAILRKPVVLHYSLPNSIHEKNRKEFEKTLCRMHFRIA
jgi:hypothetical protein